MCEKVTFGRDVFEDTDQYIDKIGILDTVVVRF